MSPGPERPLRLYCLREPVWAIFEEARANRRLADDPSFRARVKDAAAAGKTWILERGGEFYELEGAHAGASSDREATARVRHELQRRSRDGVLGAYLADLECPPWKEPRPLDHPRGMDLPLLEGYARKVLALGKNFREHAAEFGEAVPEEPLFFDKLAETLVPYGATVTVPTWYEARFDHEAELAVILAKDGRDIALEHAMDHVAGYTVANDLTLRSLQGSDRAKKHPWFRAKNFDGACPLGPCFVPRDTLDLADLRVTARVRHADGSEELRQDASTKDFVTDVPHAVAWLSRHMTLHAGDLILMGTPAGVGPLVDGDLVTCTVEGIGELTTHIARPRG